MQKITAQKIVSLACAYLITHFHREDIEMNSNRYGWEFSVISGDELFEVSCEVQFTKNREQIIALYFEIYPTTGYDMVVLGARQTAIKRGIELLNEWLFGDRYPLDDEVALSSCTVV